MNEEKFFRLWLSYVGTDFCGYQYQPKLRTVQGELEQALFSILGSSISTQAGGRTDAGVHAAGQVISLRVKTKLNQRQLTLALASRLPHDMAVWRIDEMPFAFDARRQSIGKRYIYRIGQSLVRSPFQRKFSWHVKKKLNIEAMEQAAQILVGENDYSSFRSTLCQADHARRYIWHIGITKNEDAEIKIDIRGNAFCLNMVRIIVGTLAEIGQGRKSILSMQEILNAKSRKMAGQTAPAYGLSLEQIYYPDDLINSFIPTKAKFPRYPVSPESWPINNGQIELGPF